MNKYPSRGVGARPRVIGGNPRGDERQNERHVSIDDRMDIFKDQWGVATCQLMIGWIFSRTNGGSPRVTR